ncbi:MAG: DUF1641 domain-containing protein [Firmicutes bacterium]|nr:DUF1641 domain-containing protein [Bacillota bacterium]
MTDTALDEKQDALTAALRQPDVQESLAAVLLQLPQMMEQYNAMTRTVEFAVQVLQDKESMRYLLAGFGDNLPQVTLGRETLEAAAELLGKLPKIVKYVAVAERLIDTAEAVLTDKESMQYLLDGLAEDLPGLLLNRQTLAALAALIGKLPKLVKYAGLAEQLIDTAEAVLSDKASLSYLADGVHDLAKPVRDRVESGRELWTEAQARAGRDQSPVTVLSLLKLLKDPQVQRGVHMLKALLVVSQERALKR